MKYVFFLVAILSFTNSFPSEININIEVLDETKKHKFSSAKGESLIEYNNYKLLDVISIVTQIPVQYFELEGNYHNPSINFKATSSNKLDETDLKDAFAKALKNQLGIDLSFFESIRTVQVAYSNNTRLEKCTNSMNETKKIQVNRTWKGNCVKTETLLKQIEKWFQIKIVNDLEKDGKYNFDIHHANSFEELKEELLFFYGISIKEDKRSIQALLIDFK